MHPYYTKEYSHYAKTMSLLNSYNPRNNKKYKNAIINMEKYLTIHDDKIWSYQTDSPIYPLS